MNEKILTKVALQVAGNIVNGQAIAAQIYMWHFQLELNRGYIDEINFDGSIEIRNGNIIRINDPNAVFSVVYTEAPFFTADDQNPSVTAFSGFPMCVQRSVNDTLCPASNRPFVQGTDTLQRTLYVSSSGIESSITISNSQLKVKLRILSLWRHCCLGILSLTRAFRRPMVRSSHIKLWQKTSRLQLSESQPIFGLRNPWLVSGPMMQTRK